MPLPSLAILLPTLPTLAFVAAGSAVGIWIGYGLAAVAAGVRGLYPAFTKSLFLRGMGRAVQVAGRMLTGGIVMAIVWLVWVLFAEGPHPLPPWYLVAIGGACAAIFQTLSLAAFGRAIVVLHDDTPTALQDANIFVFALWPVGMVAADFFMGTPDGRIIGPILAISVCLGLCAIPMVWLTWHRGAAWRRMLLLLGASIPFLTGYHAVLKVVDGSVATKLAAVAGLMILGGILCLPLSVREEQRARLKRRLKKSPSPWRLASSWWLLLGSGGAVMGIGNTASALAYQFLSMGQVGFFLAFTPALAVILLKRLHPDERVRPYHILLLLATIAGNILVWLDLERLFL